MIGSFSRNVATEAVGLITIKFDFLMKSDR